MAGMAKNKNNPSEIVDFIFSHHGFATAFFMVLWVIEIRKVHAWWEYVSLTILNGLAYLNSRIGAYEPPLKLFLWAQVVAGIIVALVVSFPTVWRLLQ
jgi:hypothetical protein